MRFFCSTLLIAGVSAGLLLMPGCSSNTDNVATEQPDDDHDSDGHEDHGDHDHGDHADAGHDHSGWWCVEHGVPESECALCDTSLVAGFKEKGDWCDEHNRPQSQCFTCEPELFEKFAARYEAKYGEQPPKPTD